MCFYRQATERLIQANGADGGVSQAAAVSVAAAELFELDAFGQTCPYPGVGVDEGPSPAVAFLA